MLHRLTSMFGVGILVLIGVSCTQEAPVKSDDAPFVLPGFVAQYPVVVLDNDTKSEAGEVQYRMYWNVGDVMAIVNVSQGGRVDTYTSTARVRNVDGAGRFAADAEYTYNPDDIVFAIYPYEAVNDIDLDGSVYTVSVHLTDNQSYTSKSNSPMFAKNDIQVSPLLQASSLLTYGEKSPGIDLQRMTGMIRILSHVSDHTLSSEAVSSVSVCAVGIAGNTDIKFSGKSVGATPSIVLNSGSERSLTINLSNTPKMASTTPLAEFIPVFPVWIGVDATRSGFDIVYNTTNYRVGFHREVNYNVRSNNVLAMNIFEGVYEKVTSDEDALGDSKWWYTLKAGGMNSSGSFGSEGSELGSTAGGFVE